MTMEKGYIVVDVPENCQSCQFYIPIIDMHTGGNISCCRIIKTVEIRKPEEKPDWCPIQEISQKTSQELNETIIRLL